MTKKVAKKSPDIVLLAAPTNPLFFHIRWFYRVNCRDFLDFWGALEMGFYPFRPLICEPPRANAAKALRKKPCTRFRESPEAWKPLAAKRDYQREYMGFFYPVQLSGQAKKSQAMIGCLVP